MAGVWGRSPQRGPGAGSRGGVQGRGPGAGSRGGVQGRGPGAGSRGGVQGRSPLAGARGAQPPGNFLRNRVFKTTFGIKEICRTAINWD